MGIHPSIVAFVILLIVAGLGVMIIRGNKGSVPEGFMNEEKEEMNEEEEKETIVKEGYVEKEEEKEETPEFSEDFKNFINQAKETAENIKNISKSKMNFAQGSLVNEGFQAKYEPNQTVISPDKKIPKEESPITAQHSGQPNIPSLAPSVRSMIRDDVDKVFNEISNEYEIKYSQ